MPSSRTRKKPKRKAVDLGTLAPWWPDFIADLDEIVDEVYADDTTTPYDIALALIGRAAAELVANGYSRAETLSILRQAATGAATGGLQMAAMAGFVPTPGSA